MKFWIGVTDNDWFFRLAEQKSEEVNFWSPSGNPADSKTKPLDSGLRSDDRPRNDGRDWDIRNGFVYKTVPHVTLKSLANDEPPETETLFDQPEVNKKKLRVADIAYWMVDDNYDGSNFMVRQVFFCGGDHDEFDKWKKGLSDLAKQVSKRKVEQTLKIEMDEEAFERVYGFRSHPIPKTKGRKIAVRVISQFGEESTKVLAL